MNNTFCPNCNSNFNFEFKHSCTYTNKLNSISDKFNSLHTTNSEIKSKKLKKPIHKLLQFNN